MKTEGSAVVAVLAAKPSDAGVAVRALGDGGIRGVACADLNDLRERIDRGVGAAVVSEELLDERVMPLLAGTLARQPPWSDLPILVTSHRRTDSHGTSSAAHLEPLGNVTLLDAPLRLRSFLQATRSALRARQRQYELRRALELRDEFLAMLGHELRNPLSAIALAGEHLRMELEPTPHALTILGRQTSQLTRIVDDLLDVARVSSGKMVVDRRPLDLEAGLTLWAEAFAARFAKGGVHLRVGHTESAVVDADAARLEQAVGNLLSNALKYTPRGGTVTVSVRRSDGWAVVEVADDGVGIAPEMLPKIFEQFVQVERTLDRADGGMGVGLTLVRRLVELHGGEVEVHSEGLDRGSRFALRLPLAAQRSADRPAAPPPSSSVLRWRIVLVEDNDDIREMTAVGLRDAGHSISCAVDGPSGVDLAIAQAPDVVLIDIALPGIDGYEVARQLRAHFGSKVFLVAVTGHGEPTNERDASVDFDLFLAKPIALGALLGRLESLRP